MIIFDFNPLVITSVSVATNELDGDVNDSAIRHYFLNQVLTFLKKYPEEKEIVFCCDHKNTWRKAQFPYYKIKRKDARASSPFSWDLVLSNLESLREELAEYFPYKVIQIEGAEADDLISIITRHEAQYDPESGLCGSDKKIIIISSDTDFAQLQVIPNVIQFSPGQKKLIIEPSPKRALIEKIFRGDAGDGVPNIHMPDDTFALKVRQKAIYADKVSGWVDEMEQGILHEGLSQENFDRNKKLIDLMTSIPESLEKETLDTYTTLEPASRIGMNGYFIQKKLRNLHSELSYF